MSATGLKMPIPALLTRTSRPPKRATVASTARLTSSRLRTSACSVSTAPGPAASIFGRADDRCALLSPVTETCAPSATSARAIASPMPRDPPVTSATFPCSDSIFIRIVHAMREIAIVGAGELGGACAHAIARADVARTITLIDEKGKVAAGKALDITQAAPVEGFATQLSGATDLVNAAGAELVVIADRFGGSEWQGEEALALLRRLQQVASHAIVLCAGVLARELVDRGVRELKLRRTRILGSAPEALAGAARALVALAINGAPSDVSLSVLGVPPSQTVIPWEEATVAGFALVRQLDEPARRRLEAKIASLWPLGPYVLGAAATKVITAVDGRSRQVASCFVAPEPSEGGRTKTAAMPVRLGPSGIVSVVAPSLSVVEKVALDNAMMR